MVTEALESKEDAGEVDPDMIEQDVEGTHVNLI